MTITSLWPSLFHQQMEVIVFPSSDNWHTDLSVMRQQHLSLNQLRANSLSPHVRLSVAEDLDEVSASSAFSNDP